MINICKTAFPDNKSCSFKFQKTAKCYNPDILIPSLECAIEFKYVKDEKELNRTMDEILADVEGYKGNPSYSVFYSVFYAVGSFCSPKDSIACGRKSIFRTTGKVFMSKANEVRPSLGHLI